MRQTFKLKLSGMSIKGQCRRDEPEGNAHFMFQRGAFGGIESDMVNARNLQQRGRLNAMGLLPKLSYNDTQTREVLNALRQRQSPNTVYDFYRYRDMDDIRSYADQSGVPFDNVRASDQTRDYWLRGDFSTDRKAMGPFVPPQPIDRSQPSSSRETTGGSAKRKVVGCGSSE